MQKYVIVKFLELITDETEIAAHPRHAVVVSLELPVQGFGCSLVLSLLQMFGSRSSAPAR